MTISSPSSGKTFIEKMNENEESLRAMLSMPDRANEQLPRKARKEKFGFLWQQLDMDRQEVMNLVNKRELDFVREYEHLGVPEWMLRLEAQDVLLQVMYKRYKEEGLI